VVYRGGLENRCAVRHPGFESRPLRHCRKAMALSLPKGQMAGGKKKTQKWFVYILRCRDASYYVGVATDLKERVWEHNAGQGSSFTRRRRPVELVYAEEHQNYANARKREAQLKGWRREKKKWLISGFPSTRPSDSLRT
jgi:putative endonuclease